MLWAWSQIPLASGFLKMVLERALKISNSHSPVPPISNKPSQHPYKKIRVVPTETVYGISRRFVGIGSRRWAFFSVGPTVRPTGGTLPLRGSLLELAIGRSPHALL